MKQKQQQQLWLMILHAEATTVAVVDDTSEAATAAIVDDTTEAATAAVVDDITCRSSNSSCC